MIGRSVSAEPAQWKASSWDPRPLTELILIHCLPTARIIVLPLRSAQNLYAVISADACFASVQLNFRTETENLMLDWLIDFERRPDSGAGCLAIIASEEAWCEPTEPQCWAPL